MTSIEVASAHHDDGTPIVPEVCIYFNGHLLRGNRATKANADGFNAFESYNYPHLADAGVNITYHEEHILKRDFPKKLIPHFALDTNVTVFTLFPGVQEQITRHVIESPELRARVMRTYGSGNAPHHPWLMRLLKEATSRGITVVNISQCDAGAVEMGRYDTGFQLKNMGVVSGYDSTVESALTKLMFLIGQHNDVNLVRSNIVRDICGEITVTE